MDNIQKTLVGVLSVAGIIAFVTPSGDPLAPSNSASSEQMVATPAQPNPPPTPTVQSAEEVRPEIEVRMGEPTIDGRPMMELPNDTQFNSGTQSNQESSESPNNNQQYSIPGYSQPLPYGGTPYATAPVIPQPTTPGGNYPTGTAPT